MWAVHFPRDPNNRALERYCYEYVKLYAARCDICGFEAADPSRKEMVRVMTWHIDIEHGRQGISGEPLTILRGALGLSTGAPELSTETVELSTDLPPF